MSPRPFLFVAAVAAVIGVSIGTSSEDVRMKWHTPPGAARLPVEGDVPSFGGATEWINSAPLTAAGVLGKVVLVEFWTYTCINWLRTLP